MPPAEPFQEGQRAQHKAFDAVIDALVAAAPESSGGVSPKVLGAVLEELALGGEAGRQRNELFGGTPDSARKYSRNTVAKALAVLSNERAGAKPLITTGVAAHDVKGRFRDNYVIGSAHWALAGVHVVVSGGQATSLTAALHDLNGALLRDVEKPLSGQLLGQDIAETIAETCRGLVEGSGRSLLGVGVEVPGHVYKGRVVQADHVGYSAERRRRAGDGRGGSIPLADLISKALLTKTGSLVPVVLDNDVNLMILRERYRRGDGPMPRDGAVVAVFGHGVGAGLLVSSRVHRGSGGAAGEIGHLPVFVTPDYPALTAPSAQARQQRRGAGPAVCGFSDPCSCGLSQHVDCYACPIRLTGELGCTMADFPELAGSPAFTDAGDLTAAGRAFWTGGVALGLAVLSVLETVNPGRLLLMLPKALSDADPAARRGADVTAADLYRQAVDQTVDRYAFSTTAQDARPISSNRLRVSALSTGQLGRRMAARNAALRVLDEFIAHTRLADLCSRDADGPPLPRAALLDGPGDRVSTLVQRQMRELRGIMISHDPERLIRTKKAPRSEYQYEEGKLLGLIERHAVSRSDVEAIWKQRFPHTSFFDKRDLANKFMRDLVALQNRYPARHPAGGGRASG